MTEIETTIACTTMAFVGWFIAMRRIHSSVRGDGWTTAILAGIEELLAVIALFIALKAESPLSIVGMTLGTFLGVRLESLTRRK